MFDEAGGISGAGTDEDFGVTSAGLAPGVGIALPCEPLDTALPGLFMLSVVGAAAACAKDTAGTNSHAATANANSGRSRDEIM